MTSPIRQTITSIFVLLLICTMLGTLAAVMWSSVDHRIDGIHATETYGAEQFSIQQTARFSGGQP